MTNKQKQTRRPNLIPKIVQQFVDNINKFRIDTLVRAKSLLTELNFHAFEPDDDVKSKYNDAAKFVKKIEELIVKYIPKIQGSKLTAHLEKAPPTSTVCDSDVDVVSRNHSDESFSFGATAAHLVNYAGDRGNYSQCSGVEMCSGRKEFLYSIR